MFEKLTSDSDANATRDNALISHTVPANLNDRAAALMGWHGHDRAGVRVPFSLVGGNPLRIAGGGTQVIPTRLNTKLAALARDLVNRQPDAPRWVFLVGGPRNGKSESVQLFAEAVDAALEVVPNLVEFYARNFTPTAGPISDRGRLKRAPP